MVETTAALGEYTELVENNAGESILRNTNTGTEVKLADFIDIVGPLGSESNPVAGTSHFEALSTDELSDGVAGTGNSISAVHGTDSEYHVVGVFPVLPGESIETTSDTFATLNTGTDSIEIGARGGTYDMTNMSGNLHAAISGYYQSGSTQDGTIRWIGSSDTEVTISPGNPFTGPFGEIETPFGTLEARLETQTGSDVAQFRSLSVLVAKEVGVNE